PQYLCPVLPAIPIVVGVELHVELQRTVVIDACFGDLDLGPIIRQDPGMEVKEEPSVRPNFQIIDTTDLSVDLFPCKVSLKVDIETGPFLGYTFPIDQILHTETVFHEIREHYLFLEQKDQICFF